MNVQKVGFLIQVYSGHSEVPYFASNIVRKSVFLGKKIDFPPLLLLKYFICPHHTHPPRGKHNIAFHCSTRSDSKLMSVCPHEQTQVHLESKKKNAGKNAESTWENRGLRCWIWNVGKLRIWKQNHSFFLVFCSFSVSRLVQSPRDGKYGLSYFAGKWSDKRGFRKEIWKKKPRQAVQIEKRYTEKYDASNLHSRSNRKLGFIFSGYVASTIPNISGICCSFTKIF